VSMMKGVIPMRPDDGEAELRKMEAELQRLSRLSPSDEQKQAYKRLHLRWMNAKRQKRLF